MSFFIKEPSIIYVDKDGAPVKKEEEKDKKKGAKKDEKT